MSFICFVPFSLTKSRMQHMLALLRIKSNLSVLSYCHQSDSITIRLTFCQGAEEGAETVTHYLRMSLN